MSAQAEPLASASSVAPGRVARLLPWLLLWVAAPAPLWLALGMAWYFAR